MHRAVAGSVADDGAVGADVLGDTVAETIRERQRRVCSAAICTIRPDNGCGVVQPADYVSGAIEGISVGVCHRERVPWTTTRQADGMVLPQSCRVALIKTPAGKVIGAIGLARGAGQRVHAVD